MQRIAIINMGAHGHVNPTIPVTAELVKRGAEVLYFTTKDFETSVRETRAKFFAFDSKFTGSGPAPGAQGPELFHTFPARLMAECIHVAPQIENALKDFKPDLIIYDRMCLAGRVLSEAMKVRAAAFCPSYVANEHFSLAQGMPPPPKDHPAMAEFRADSERVAKRYGGKPLMPHEMFTRCEPLNIVFMPRAFQYRGDTFDDRFVFVGPSIAPRPDAGTWQPTAGDTRPILFVSLGTVFNAWPEFFQMSLEAFGGSAYRVLMASGKRVEREALGTIPANIEIASHWPQLDILPHASVFITHGGMNSTQESLYFGVPMVVIPQMMEQAATARRITELGLGKGLKREDVTPAVLRQAVDDVANDATIKPRLVAMQKEVRGAGGQSAAATALIDYLRRA